MFMDILDALEQQVSTLLQDLTDLKAENAQLKKRLEGKSAGGSDQADQPRAKERELQTILAQRIDNLVTRLEKQIIAD